MDIFDRKKQGGVFGTCYAHKNIHYHDPKLGAGATTNFA